MRARVCETKRETGQQAEERNSRQTRPRNTAHSAHFPALSYYSLSEPSRAGYESARSRAEHLNCIWVKPKHHRVGNASLLSQIDEVESTFEKVDGRGTHNAKFPEKKNLIFLNRYKRSK